MTIQLIRNDDDLKAVFHRLETLFQAEEQTPEADERDVLVTLAEAYENKHCDFGPADPVEAIKFRMEQRVCRRATSSPSSGRAAGCPKCSIASDV